MGLCLVVSISPPAFLDAQILYLRGTSANQNLLEVLWTCPEGRTELEFAAPLICRTSCADFHTTHLNREPELEHAIASKCNEEEESVAETELPVGRSEPRAAPQSNPPCFKMNEFHAILQKMENFCGNMWVWVKMGTQDATLLNGSRT